MMFLIVKFSLLRILILLGQIFASGSNAVYIFNIMFDIYSIFIYFLLAQHSIEGQNLLTECCSHIHLSADRGEQSSSQFRHNLWSARRVHGVKLLLTIIVSGYVAIIFSDFPHPLQSSIGPSTKLYIYIYIYIYIQRKISTTNPGNELGTSLIVRSDIMWYTTSTLISGIRFRVSGTGFRSYYCQNFNR